RNEEEDRDREAESEHRPEVRSHEGDAIGDRRAAHAERIVEEIISRRETGHDQLERDGDDRRRREQERDDEEHREDREADDERGEAHAERRREAANERLIGPRAPAERELLPAG